MDFEQLSFVFPKAEQYVFFFDDAHLLLLSWDRDSARFLFLITDSNTQQLGEHRFALDYAGQLYTERVLEAVENIFFVELTEDGKAPRKYVLGSFFEVEGKHYGAYYERERATVDVLLFRIEGESPQYSLQVLEDLEFACVSEAFSARYREVMDIRT